jgi:MFS family permease
VDQDVNPRSPGQGVSPDLSVPLPLPPTFPTINDSGPYSGGAAVESASSPPARRGGFARAFLALRHRNFRLYWFGQLISLMGSGMQTLGQAWLVLRLTHSAWQLGVVGALQYVPVLLFSIFGGVFADRWPKRPLLLATQSAAMVQALLLWALVATNQEQLWQIYVLAVLLGFTSSLDQPARSAFVVELAGREDLPNAVALNSSLMNLARIVGPGLGGLIIAATDVTTLFLINGLSFLAMLVALALVNRRELHAQVAPPAAGERQSAWQSLREGIVYVWQTPVVALAIVVAGLVLLFGANFNVVLPLFATDVLGVGATGFGFLSAALGVGALLAALALAWTNAKPTVGRMLLGALAFSVLELAFAFSQHYLASLALLAAVGFGETVYTAMATTTVQTITPDRLRGRVTSVLIFSFSGSVVPGYLLAGWLSAAFGAPMGLVICMVICLLIVGAGWLWRGPAERRAAQVRELAPSAARE